MLEITKDMLSSWERENDKDYDILLDDELIISVPSNVTSKQIADYILECQTLAKDYDRLLNIVQDLKRRLRNREY